MGGALRAALRLLAGHRRRADEALPGLPPRSGGACCHQSWPRTWSSVSFSPPRVPAATTAISSHTGALAGDAVIFEAAMNQAGAILTHSMESLFDTTSSLLLSHLPAPVHLKKTVTAPVKVYNKAYNRNGRAQVHDHIEVEGRAGPPQLRIGIVVSGGGFSVDMIDTFSSMGLKKAELSPETVKKMGEVLPGINTFIVNPVDIGDQGYHPDVFKKILELYKKGEDLSWRRVSLGSYSSLGHAAIKKYRFGSWENALRAVGIDYTKIRKYREWDREKIKEEILRLHRDGIPVNSKNIQKIYPALYHASRNKFNSWREAIEYAGLDYKKIALRITRKPEEILEELKKIREEGGILSDTYMRKYHPALHASACRAFGCWSKARKMVGDFTNYRKKIISYKEESFAREQSAT